MRAVINGIDISFAFCAVAGMKAFRRLLRFGYSYVPGQHGIKYEWQLFGGDGAFIVKMGALAKSMNARVCPAGALNDNSSAGNGFEDIF